MNHVARIWLAAAVVVGACGCGSSGFSDPAGPKPPQGTPLFFDVTYQNQAWGYQLYGWFLTEQGDIWRFNHSDRRMDVGGDVISAAILMEKYSHGRQFVRRVDADSVQAMIALVPAAAAGAITGPAPTGCRDAGAQTYQVWRLLPGGQSYGRVLVHMRGDYGARNAAPAAATLRQWLDRLTGLGGSAGCELQ